MGKVWVPISQTFPISWILLHFPMLWEIYGKTHAFPICWSIPQDGNRMGKKHPYYGKSMSISFSDFPHTMGFVAFSRAVGNLWGNPCIPHMLKYTIRWESNGKKAPVLWERYGYRFPRLPPYHGFCCIFPYCGKFMRNPCISHMMTSVNFFPVHLIEHFRWLLQQHSFIHLRRSLSRKS